MKILQLKDIGKVVTGKTPATSNISNWGGDLCFVTPTDFKYFNKNIYETERKITSKAANSLKNIILPKNSVIVTCIGSDMGKVAINKVPVISNQQINAIICNNDIVNYDYLYYQLASKYELLRLLGAGGSTMPIVNKSTFEQIHIPLPPLPEQERIAGILSAYDDKIALNRRMAATLEQMARTLFRQWFVAFDFPTPQGLPYRSSGGPMQPSELGDIPLGWAVKSIGQIIGYHLGGDWGKDEPDDEHTEQVFVLRGTDIQGISSGNISKVPMRYIKKKNLEKRRLEVGDILFEISGGSTDQSTGRNLALTHYDLALFNPACVPASFCRLIRPISIEYNAYLAITLDLFYEEGLAWHYQNQSTGISNFQFSHFIDDYQIVIPPETILSSFSNSVSAFMQKVAMLRIENHHLTAQRDLLLQKLFNR